MRMCEILAEFSELRLRYAIFKILSDEELRRRFGEEGRRMVREEFGWEKIIEKIYLNLAEK